MKSKIVTCIAATTNYCKDDTLTFTRDNLMTFCDNIKETKIYIYKGFYNDSTNIVGLIL